METSSIIQVVSILLAVVGTWLLAFALRTWPLGDMSPRERRKRGVVGITDIDQNPVMFWWGLGLITFAGVLQITMVTAPNLFHGFA